MTTNGNHTTDYELPESDPRTLLKPFKLGKFNLKNRIAVSPMTRGRATLDARFSFLPNKLTEDYYASRASAGLIITEGVHINNKARGWVNVPGIWSDEQTKEWTKVASAVHEKGGLISMQLWHQGRTTHSNFGNGQPWSASAIACADNVRTPNGSVPAEVPHEMTKEEIQLTVGDYVTAAKNAFKAGFDQVQIHSANGYLLQQFISDASNKRTDEYGGSAKNRAKFLIDILLAMKKEFGTLENVSVRLSPTTLYNTCLDSKPIETFSTVVSEIQSVAPDLAFLEIVEDTTNLKPEQYTASHLRKIWKGVFMLNSNVTDKTGQEIINKGEADLVAIGRPFISNPDLIYRYKKQLPLTDVDYSRLFYVDTDLAKGYTDYKNYTLLN